MPYIVVVDYKMSISCGYPTLKTEILFLPESTEGVVAGQTTAMNYENAADNTESHAETVAKQDGLNKF